MEKQRNTPLPIDVSSNSVVDAVRSNNRSVLRQLYLQNFPKVLAMVLKDQGNQDQARDIFQEAFIAVWKNIREERFIPESESAIHGYIYTIARNKWLDLQGSLRYRKTVSLSPGFHHPSEQEEYMPVDNQTRKEEKISLVMKALESIEDACKGLLIKFYFEKKSLKEIAEELQIDPASARNKKYRCMQTLRELAFKSET